MCAIVFLCREVLGVDVEDLSLTAAAKRGIHLPVVLSVPETLALLGAMRGMAWLMAALMYGGGLRVSECCGLRVKDVDFDQELIFVRGGKGNKDRSTLLAETGRDELHTHLRASETLHRADRSAGLAGVWLPEALDRKYPNGRPRTGMVLGISESDALHRPACRRRPSSPHQRVGDPKAVKAAAVEAKIHQPVSPHTLRHCFATRLLLNGVDIRQIQDYLGHANVETTMIYTHVVKELRNRVRSPLDILRARPMALSAQE